MADLDTIALLWMLITALVISIPATLVVTGIARGIALYQSYGALQRRPVVPAEDDQRIRLIVREQTRTGCVARQETRLE